MGFAEYCHGEAQGGDHVVSTESLQPQPVFPFPSDAVRILIDCYYRAARHVDVDVVDFYALKARLSVVCA